MKAKTTDKRTREVKKKKIHFSATTGGKTVGSASTCDLHVDDSNVSALHARVGLGDDGNAYIHTSGRTYFLIGACARCMVLHASVSVFLCGAVRSHRWFLSCFNCSPACFERACARSCRCKPKFWTHGTKLSYFCDTSVREKAWRSRKRVAQAT